MVRRSGEDGFDDGVVPGMRWRWPRVRLDTSCSMVCSESWEVVSIGGTFVLPRRPWRLYSGELVLVVLLGKK